MCSHWQSEYDATPCGSCEADQKFSDKVDALYTAVRQVLENTWGGDDCRAHLKEAVEAFKREQA